MDKFREGSGERKTKEKLGKKSLRFDEQRTL